MCLTLGALDMLVMSFAIASPTSHRGEDLSNASIAFNHGLDIGSARRVAGKTQASKIGINWVDKFRCCTTSQRAR